MELEEAFKKPRDDIRRAGCRASFHDGAWPRSDIRAGVRLISITQDLGDNPMSVMMRQIMTLFDEYQSKENAKHTLRAMKENARQGYWNGALPPIGYRIVAAEQRGAKIKKKLEIDPIHADTVRHYTSVPNILKVLNPLFLDDLRAHLEESADNARSLIKLRKRMARIRVFDPACGSGNLLVIAYKAMREIEAEINTRRRRRCPSAPSRGQPSSVRSRRAKRCGRRDARIGGVGLPTRCGAAVLVGRLLAQADPVQHLHGTSPILCFEGGEGLAGERGVGAHQPALSRPRRPYAGVVRLASRKPRVEPFAQVGGRH